MTDLDRTGGNRAPPGTFARPPNLPVEGRPTTSHRPGRGMAFAVLGSMLLTSNDTIAKYLTESWPVGQIMSSRGSIILIAILVVMGLRGTLHRLRVQHPIVTLVRAASIVGGTFTFMTALSLMPIADAVAIVFISPVFGTLLAVATLKERVGWRRWAAMLFGLVGVAIALNPSGMFSDAPPPYDWTVALLPLATALLVAVRDVSSRFLVSGDDSLAIMFYTVLGVTLSGYATLGFVDWQPVSASQAGFILLAAIFMFGAYFFQIESFRFAEVNVIAPFRYASLIFAAGIGYIVWGDLPTVNMAIGSVLIVASGLFIWWRERQKQSPPE